MARLVRAFSFVPMARLARAFAFVRVALWLRCDIQKKIFEGPIGGAFMRGVFYAG